MPRQANKSAMVKSSKPRRKMAVRRPRRQGLRGHGDYTYDKPGPFGRAGRYIGSALGSAYAGAGGAKLGEKLGSYLHYIGKIFGSGDYVTSADQVRGNVLTNSSQIPHFGSGKANVHIQHREFLGDIYSSNSPGQFKIDSYAINPGLSVSFPWLSQVCGASFQQYRLNGLVYEFRSMSADALNSTNTALGSVIMATDYDSKDAVFTTKQQMENTEFGVSCKPSSCMLHAIECARSQTPVNELYIRAFDVPAGADIRLYDLGRMSIATQGMQAASVNLGELWSSYDLNLLKAIEQPPNFLTEVAEYQLNLVDATHSLGLTQTLIVDQFPIVFNYVAGVASITLPLSLQAQTKLLILYRVFGAATAGVASVTPTASGGITVLNGTRGYISTPDITPTLSDMRGVACTFIYDGTGTVANPPKIAISAGVVPTAITDSSLSVFQIGAAFI